MGVSTNFKPHCSFWIFFEVFFPFFSFEWYRNTLNYISHLEIFTKLGPIWVSSNQLNKSGSIEPKCLRSLSELFLPFLKAVLSWRFWMSFIRINKTFKPFRNELREQVDITKNINGLFKFSLIGKLHLLMEKR